MNPFLPIDRRCLLRWSALCALGTCLSAPAETPGHAHWERIETRRYALHEGFWKPRVRHLVVSYVPFIMDVIENDKSPWKIFARYKAVAERRLGRNVPNPCVHNWAETTLLNTFESMCWALTVDPQGDAEMIAAQEKIRAGVERWIPVILGAQEPDGYLCTDVQMRGFPRFVSPRIAGVRQGEKQPEELAEDHHEGYMMGYFIECAIAHYHATDGKDLRMYHAAKKGADLFCDTIGDPPKLAWQPDHEELEQALARFSLLVDEIEGAGAGRKYLKLAKWLLDNRGVTTPHTDAYRQKNKPLTQQKEPYGHAVMFAYLYAGAADVARLNGDKVLADSADRVWERLVNSKLYLNGGIGSKNEEFGPAYDLPNDALMAETCGSIGNLLFQQNLNLLHADARFADLAEIILYNGILGAVALDEPKWQYFNPLDQKQGGHPTCRHNKKPDCCMGNISRTLLRLPSWIYARSKDGLVVNQFIASTVMLDDVAGTRVLINQQTDYPWNGKIVMTVTPDKKARFGIRIRMPGRWPGDLYVTTPATCGDFSIRLNGQAIAAAGERGYALIDREWSRGDRIEIEMPLQPMRVKCDPRVAANAGRVALQYGPLVYNIESVDLPGGVTPDDVALSPSSPLGAEWDADHLGGVMTIRGKFAGGEPLRAIPYYARMNRLSADAGQAIRPVRSLVWIKES